MSKKLVNLVVLLLSLVSIALVASACADVDDEAAADVGGDAGTSVPIAQEPEPIDGLARACPTMDN